MKLNEIAVDTEKEAQGDWIESPRWPGVWAHVRSIHHPDYRRAVQAQLQKLRRKYGQEPIPPEVNDRINAKLFVDYILNDLKGIEDDDGAEIAYDKDFGLKIMQEPAYRPLADFVSWAATVVGEDVSEQAETDAKNSQGGSSGKQSTGRT